jgi:tRNA pseudouridine55 synthase
MAARSLRAPRQRVDGVLLLDKPAGISSNAALQRARRAFNADKAGHTGTLDPLASGLLPVCFGEATKFARFLLDADKHYVATVRFGVATTTQDAEGEVVETQPVAFGRAEVLQALSAFLGVQTQVPPAHSALKYQGRSYYHYAREGVEIPREARTVRIDRLDLLDWTHPDAIVDVVCGKGTYVRALAADLGAALRCGAHLRALRRIAAGGFELAAATPLDVLESAAPDARAAMLLPVDRLLDALPRIDVDSGGAADLRCGRPVPWTGRADPVFRVYDSAGDLIGVVRNEAGALVPERMARDRLQC